MGVVDTSSTDDATVVSSSDVIQLAKCAARKAPATAGILQAPGRRAPSPARANGRRTSAPAAQRQNEIASGSAPSA